MRSLIFLFFGERGLNPVGFFSFTRCTVDWTPKGGSTELGNFRDVGLACDSQYPGPWRQDAACAVINRGMWDVFVFWGWRRR